MVEFATYRLDRQNNIDWIDRIIEQTQRLTLLHIGWIDGIWNRLKCGMRYALKIVKLALQQSHILLS